MALASLDSNSALMSGYALSFICGVLELVFFFFFFIIILLLL